MYFISGGIGFIACIIFIILIVIFALRGKSCKTPLIALFLSVLLFLGSGFLYSRTDPSVGGADFLKYVIRDQTVPPDLWGEWRDSGGDEDSFHGIYIYDNTIEVYWVTEGGLSTSLYWAGTFDAPPDGREPYTWESVCDEERTSAAQLAANETTKTFTYNNGILSYDANILGVSTTIEARKQPWFPAEDGEDDAANTQSPAVSAPAQLTTSGSLGDYAVEVKSASLTTDLNGDPAIIVTYSWTNNSGSTTNAMVAMLEKAFQNGVQLPSAIIGNPDIYDSGARMLDVQPGYSIDVQCAYALSSEKTPVEFEVSELFSTSGDTVVMSFTLDELPRVANDNPLADNPEE